MSLRLVCDHESLFATLADLVSINSINPQYPGGPGEAALAAYVGHYLTQNRIPFEFQPVFDGRPNVIARLKGQPGDHTLILEAHMDTASVLGMSRKPFEPVREGTRMFGRGACDTKGGLAAMLHALKTLCNARLQPKATVVLVAAVDEEYSFRGVVKFLEMAMKADAAIVAEPTDLEIVVASKGALRWRLHTHGRAAHSSKPHLGINAVTKMAKVIVAMEERFPPLFEKSKHRLVGSPTLNVGIVHGGVQVNQVPDSCTIEIDRRLIPGETKESIWGEFKSFLAELQGSDPELEVEMEAPSVEDCPLETPATERIVQVLTKVSGEILGRGRAIGVPYGSDASKLAKAGIPAVIFGPGSIDQAHAAEEFVELDQVAQAAEIYAQTILEF